MIRWILLSDQVIVILTSVLFHCTNVVGKSRTSKIYSLIIGLLVITVHIFFLACWLFKVSRNHVLYLHVLIPLLIYCTCCAWFSCPPWIPDFSSSICLLWPKTSIDNLLCVRVILTTDTLACKLGWCSAEYAFHTSICSKKRVYIYTWHAPIG
jgi:hypothetical protein